MSSPPGFSDSSDFKNSLIIKNWISVSDSQSVHSDFDIFRNVPRLQKCLMVWNSGPHSKTKIQNVYQPLPSYGTAVEGTTGGPMSNIRDSLLRFSGSLDFEPLLEECLLSKDSCVRDVRATLTDWNWLLWVSRKIDEAHSQTVSASAKKESLSLLDAKFNQDFITSESLRTTEDGMRTAQKETISQINKMLGPYRVANDSLFIKLRQTSFTSLPDILVSELSAVQYLLLRLDNAIVDLEQTSHHKEARKHIAMYSSFRSDFCRNLRSITMRSLERCESVLTARIQKLELQFQKKIQRKQQTEKFQLLSVPFDEVQKTKESIEERKNDSYDYMNVLDPVKYHIKFRAYGVNIFPLANLLLKRFSDSGCIIYNETLQQLQNVYAGIRLRFIFNAFCFKIDSIFEKSTEESLDIVVRHVTTFWLSAASLEVTTFKSFFPSTSYIVPLKTILDNLGGTVYSSVRKHLVSVSDLEVLSSICDSLTFDLITPIFQLSNENIKTNLNTISDQIKNENENLNSSLNPNQPSQELHCALSVVLKLFQDAQEKLIFESYRFLDLRIGRYQPTSDDLDYPSILENSKDSSSVYYPAVNLACLCLSTLSESIPKDVFHNIAHEIISEGLNKVDLGAQVMSSCGKDKIITSLFVIRNAFCLRDRIDATRYDFVKIEKSFNFAKLRQKIKAILAIIWETSGQKEESDKNIKNEINKSISIKSNPDEISRDVRNGDVQLKGSSDGFLSFVTPQLEDAEFGVRETLDLCISQWTETLIGSIAEPITNEISKMVKFVSTVVEVTQQATDELNIFLEMFWNSLQISLPNILHLIYLFFFNVNISPDSVKLNPLSSVDGDQINYDGHDVDGVLDDTNYDLYQKLRIFHIYESIRLLVTDGLKIVSTEFKKKKVSGTIIKPISIWKDLGEVSRSLSIFRMGFRKEFEKKMKERNKGYS